MLFRSRKLGPDRKAERPKQAGVGRIFVMRYHAARRKRRASGKNGMDGPALPAVAGMDVEPAYISHESVSGSLAQLVGRILACRGKAAKAAESASCKRGMGVGGFARSQDACPSHPSPRGCTRRIASLLASESLAQFPACG